MHEIVVDMVGTQPLELLVKEPIKILGALTRGMGKLGCDKDLVAQAKLFERHSHASLVAWIEIGCIQVVNALLDGAGDNILRRLRVGPAQLITREAHAAQAQSRKPVAACRIRSVLHARPFLSILEHHHTALKQTVNLRATSQYPVVMALS